MREAGPCPACGSRSSAEARGRAGLLGYRGCGSCGHVWLHDLPSDEELRAHYNGAYSVPREDYARTAAREYPFVASLLACHQVTPGVMLEIGCSNGEMLSRFEQSAWSVEGIELDVRAAQEARTRLGLPVHSGTLEDFADRREGTVDCVTAYHVIEHVTDPRAFLDAAHRVLRPNGSLLLKTPNAASLAARSPAGSWEWYLRPEHLHLFSPRSLALMLHVAGFRIVTVVTRRGDANSTLLELVKGAARRVTRRDQRIRSRQAKGATPPAGAPGRTRNILNALGAPLDLALGAADWMGAHLGPELVVLARRVSR